VKEGIYPTQIGGCHAVAFVGPLIIDADDFSDAKRCKVWNDLAAPAAQSNHSNNSPFQQLSQKWAVGEWLTREKKVFCRRRFREWPSQDRMLRHQAKAELIRRVVRLRHQYLAGGGLNAEDDRPMWTLWHDKLKPGQKFSRTCQVILRHCDCSCARMRVKNEKAEALVESPVQEINHVGTAPAGAVAS
jgi:hypothetical protein